jgi:hypothetical protein
MKKSMENAFDLIKKGTVTIIHEDDLRLKLESGKKLKIKLSTVRITHKYMSAINTIAILKTKEDL